MNIWTSHHRQRKGKKCAFPLWRINESHWVFIGSNFLFFSCFNNSFSLFCHHSIAQMIMRQEETFPLHHSVALSRVTNGMQLKLKFVVKPSVDWHKKIRFVTRFRHLRILEHIRCVLAESTFIISMKFVFKQMNTISVNINLNCDAIIN